MNLEHILKRPAFLRIPTFRKPRKKKKRSKKIGLPPGTPIYVGEETRAKVRISFIQYNEQDYQEEVDISFEECDRLFDENKVTWINVDGVHDVELIERIGRRYGLHSLVVEDIVDTDQRPKIEEFGEYLFISMKMLDFDNENSEIIRENVSMILGDKYLISFQQKVGDVFDLLRKRLRDNKGRARRAGSDYLAFALMDTMVDHYFSLMDRIGDTVEDLEVELMTDPKPDTLHKIYFLKREMVFLRRSIVPLREIVGRLDRSDSDLISEQTGKYFRDLYDHCIQTIEMTETYRDMLSGMLDLYLSSISNRMNEVMKVLTIIATVFIPLTFIAGIYGMNFSYMPELDWKWGYFMIWSLIIIIAVVMMAYFHRKRWL